MHEGRLAYVVVEAADPPAWQAFLVRYLGAELFEGADGIRARIDRKFARLFVESGGSNRLSVIGWESDAPSAMRVADALAAAGVPIAELAHDECRRRGVQSGIAFADRAGNRLEWVIGQREDTAEPALSRPLGRYRTGALGLGHVVLNTTDIAADRAFYEEILGFRLTDTVAVPFSAAFMRINPRHHSLALIGGERDGVHHLMFEVCSFDDVGQTYDLALGEDGRIATTLGRHTNDFMTSFYMNTPADFLIEFGWGGRLIDDADWTPVELASGPSLWGHERSWLPEAARARAREMRLQAAAEGLKAPLHLTPGQFVVDES